MAMFESFERIYGKHAEIMQKYCDDRQGDQQIAFIVSNNDGEKSSDQRTYIFKTKMQLFMVAAMLGIINKRQADVDRSSETNATIMADMLNKERPNLERIYHHMVLSEDNGLSVDEKIKKAFSVNKSDEEWKAEQERFESYVRGGLEIIEELFGNCGSYEDICNAIFDLCESLEIYNVEETA